MFTLLLYHPELQEGGQIYEGGERSPTGVQGKASDEGLRSSEADDVCLFQILIS